MNGRIVWHVLRQVALAAEPAGGGFETACCWPSVSVQDSGQRAILCVAFFCLLARAVSCSCRHDGPALPSGSLAADTHLVCAGTCVTLPPSPMITCSVPCAAHGCVRSARGTTTPRARDASSLFDELCVLPDGVPGRPCPVWCSGANAVRRRRRGSYRGAQSCAAWLAVRRHCPAGPASSRVQGHVLWHVLFVWALVRAVHGCRTTEEDWRARSRIAARMCVCLWQQCTVELCGGTVRQRNRFVHNTGVHSG